MPVNYLEGLFPEANSGTNYGFSQDPSRFSDGRDGILGRDVGKVTRTAKVTMSRTEEARAENCIQKPTESCSSGNGAARWLLQFLGNATAALKKALKQMC